MIEEVVDKKSGAILFKETQETKDLRYALKKIEELEERIKKLENNNKEDS